jgi:hypothetical protein
VYGSAVVHVCVAVRQYAVVHAAVCGSACARQ